MGLVTVGARLGGILAPYIVMLGDDHENLQFTVFGMLSLAAGGIVVHKDRTFLLMNQHRSCKLEASGNLGKTSARHCGRHEQAPWRWKRFLHRREIVLLFTGGKVPTKLESVEGSEPLMQEEEDS